jgi:hypothetical protein
VSGAKLLVRLVHMPTKTYNCRMLRGCGMATLFVACSALPGCGGNSEEGAQQSQQPSGAGGQMQGPPVDVPNPLTDPSEGPPAGNGQASGSSEHCAVPAQAGLADSSNPDHVVGTGTPESCTADLFIAAVAQGGVITFDCGPDPITITLDRPAKVVNDTGPEIVIDGAGLVTLSGGGNTRILYMNTCDEAQGWTTDHCNDQDHPRLTVQNLTFIDANSKNESEYDGGGAIWVRGGRFKVINSRFFNNVCADTGPDVGGAGVRVFDQHQDQPVYVVNSTFGGVFQQPGDRQRRQPTAGRNAGGWQRGRHLQRRQSDDTLAVRRAHRAQRSEHARQRDFLREQ